MKLSEAKVGEAYKVISFQGEGAVRRRLLDMGVTKGTTVCVRKVAPLGDPVQVTLRGYEMSFRRHEVECVLVEEAK